MYGLPESNAGKYTSVKERLSVLGLVPDRSIDNYEDGYSDNEQFFFESQVEEEAEIEVTHQCK